MYRPSVTSRKIYPAGFFAEKASPKRCGFQLPRDGEEIVHEDTGRGFTASCPGLSGSEHKFMTSNDKIR